MTMTQAQGQSPGSLPASRFYRSVRVERDLASAGSLAGYQVTPQVRALLLRIAQGLAPGGNERAWTLTGPYGSGKSAFALMAAYVFSELSDSDSEAWSLLRSADPGVAAALADIADGKRLLPVVATLRRVPLRVSLLEAAQDAASLLARASGRSSPRKRSWAKAVADSVDTRYVISALERLLEDGAKAGYGGLFIVLDELGKGLEYAAHHPSDDDVFLLQDLAETAQRSRDYPWATLGILHQGFERYAEQLDPVARQEWAKIQGRYVDVAFIEPPEQQMRLAAQAINSVWAMPEERRLQNRDLAARICAAPAGQNLPGRDLPDLAADSSPLHPLALVALPYLFRRFAQNERSLFAYILGEEPFGLRSRVGEGTGAPARLSDLFDYFVLNLGGSMARQSSGRRWIEVTDAIEGSPDLSAAEVDVLKTVGLLTVLGDVSPLRATGDLISLAVADGPHDEDVATALNDLRSRSMLTFRRYNQTYRVWEGSDIDLEERLDTGRQLTRGQMGLAATIMRYLPKRPLVARRHSYDNGALRMFEVKYLDSTADHNLEASPGMDGLVVCCIPSCAHEVNEFLSWARDPAVAGQSDVLVVVPEQIGGLREAASELSALRWVWDNTPQLRDDRIARKELSEMTMAVEASVAGMASRLLDPRPEPEGSGATWVYRGLVQPISSTAQVSRLLSKALDSVYSSSPVLKNELICRRVLSSAAAAARRNLVERMISLSTEPLLGFDSDAFPPERSMYESILRSTGLHRRVAGQFGFFAPPIDSPSSLSATWSHLEKLVYSPTLEPITVDRVFGELSRPPYGVMAGVQPVLLVAFMLANDGEVSLYREGGFVPDYGMADFELLMRRPELFAVGGVRITGVRKDIIERLAKSLKTEPGLVPVTRALVRMVRSLPDAAWHTRALPPETIRLREAIESARSPEQLLFTHIPLAVGMGPFDDGARGPDALAELFDRLNRALQSWAAYSPAMLMEARNSLLEACGLSASDEGWHDLRGLATAMVGSPVGESLVPLLKRLSMSGDDDTTLQSVLALLAGKPPRVWSDVDAEAFPSLASVIGTQFVHARYALVALTPDEERQKKRIARGIALALGNGAPPHVKKAALAEMLRELEAQPSVWSSEIGDQHE